MTHEGEPFLVAGIDFGSDSVRVLVMDAYTGKVAGHAAHNYPRWAAGQYSDSLKNQFRQHPKDHLEALTACFKDLEDQVDRKQIKALAADSTGSTPVPLNEDGVALAMLPEYEDDPDAMFWLWKDYTAIAEAAEVDAALRNANPDHTTYQGRYSPEWWWAKILKSVRDRPEFREAAPSWAEHSDWIAGTLTGRTSAETFERNACAGGHKALFNRALGGKVPQHILSAIDPYLAAVQASCKEPVVAGTPLGKISNFWAEQLGLSTDTIVGVGSLDAHAGAVGAGIKPRRLVKVIGTSTVDMFLTDYASVDGAETREICGLAEDSIVPGHLGGEAGQAAFGDLFAWYQKILSWPLEFLLPKVVPSQDRHVVDNAVEEAQSQFLRRLDQEAAARTPSDIVALDWINGRRYPYPDGEASAALLNLRIGHDAVDIYAAIVEAAVLGSKHIYETLRQVGIGFDEVVLVGGIAAKSPYVCQAIANGLGVPIMVSSETEVCAKGAAMYAAVAAGAYGCLEDAQAELSEPFRIDYVPKDPEVQRYNAKYTQYLSAGRSLADLT